MIVYCSFRGMSTPVNKQGIVVFAPFCSFLVAGAYTKYAIYFTQSAENHILRNYMMRKNPLFSELSNQIIPCTLTSVSL